MLKQRYLITAMIILSLEACGTYSSSSFTPAAHPPDAAAHSPKTPDQIIVTEEDILGRKYASLGDISVTVRKLSLFDKDPTRDKINKALKERAAEMGADAVVLVRYGTVGVGILCWGQLDGDGRAVVFQ